MLKSRLRGTHMTAAVGIEFMGADFVAEINFRVTYWGCEAQTYGPPENCYPAEAPEWEIDGIILFEDRVDAFGPDFEATGALFDVLAECDAVTDAVMDAIEEGHDSLYNSWDD